MEILPSNQKKLFYSDNGSTAVEVAIKTALQYNYNKGIKKTKKGYTCLCFQSIFIQHRNNTYNHKDNKQLMFVFHGIGPYFVLFKATLFTNEGKT